MLPFPNAPPRRLVLLLRFNRLSQLYPNLRSLPNDLLPPLPSNFWRHSSLVGPVCWPLEAVAKVGDGGLIGPVCWPLEAVAKVGDGGLIGPVCWPLEAVPKVGDGGLFGPVVSSSTALLYLIASPAHENSEQVTPYA
ncbi:PREDICTED: uncharacterized protein LOC109240406 isoform X1 [Nicotiana attenuata]|uniref:uncharacterized protein LOC109240406 isoform X1 n=1 Tax=Nicotiana attenuata TaxID=49451 RepID=UPI0009046CD6|nr:PREDICTED: uncharacterized protein LOC109240406 isoform X1 [Nicotiana attenuata]XP_019262585.1 PREDICTED: uncharacterized protein LOC109240406 isoform X1 [Nicotiana attenuata]